MGAAAQGCDDCDGSGSGRSRWSLWSQDSFLCIASQGSVLSIGMGGVVEDQITFDSLRFLPLTDADAERLIGDSRLDALVPEGSARRAALCDVLLRVAALADAVPELVDVRLNPVIVTGDTASVTDVRARLARVDHDEFRVRRLVDDL